MFGDRFLQKEEKTLYEALAPRTRSFLMFPSITQPASQPLLLRYFALQVDIMTLRTARREEATWYIAGVWWLTSAARSRPSQDYMPQTSMAAVIVSVAPQRSCAIRCRMSGSLTLPVARQKRECGETNIEPEKKSSALATRANKYFAS